MPANSNPIPGLAVTMLFLLIALLGLSMTATAQEDTEVTELLQSSATAMLELESFHFVFSTPVGKTILADEVFLESVEGDVVRPMSFQATFEVSLAFLTLDLNAVGIDENIWISNPLEGGKFEQVSGEGEETLPPLPFLNPDALIQEAVSQIQNPQITGDEEIDGVETTVVIGEFDPDAITVDGTPIADALAGELEPLGLTLWIDADHRVIRAEFSGGLLPSEIGAGRIVRRIDLSQFNEPVVIVAPAS